MTPPSLMPECPKCHRSIPPKNGGLVRTRRRGRRITYTVGRWCLGCEQWWIIEVSVLATEYMKEGDPHRRVYGPRKAAAIEAAMAAKAVFARQGLALPVD